MGRSIRYHPIFDADVIDAADWYDARAVGLGDAFVNNVRQTIESIISDPSRFAETPGGLRYQRVHRFPYVVLFTVTDSELLLLGTLHTARSIEKWRSERG
ncbi:MAG: type II toxin-antitoxin system RelE/ParE family toxin [Planctomycetaceae bacterium]|jgi:hypothetical protein